MKRFILIIPIIIIMLFTLSGCQSWDEYWNEQHEKSKQWEEQRAAEQRELEERQNNCEHEWVQVSRYSYMHKSYYHIQKCTKCGKEVQ